MHAPLPAACCAGCARVGVSAACLLHLPWLCVWLQMHGRKWSGCSIAVEMPLGEAPPQPCSAPADGSSAEPTAAQHQPSQAVAQQQAPAGDVSAHDGFPLFVVNVGDSMSSQELLRYFRCVCEGVGGRSNARLPRARRRLSPAQPRSSLLWRLGMGPAHPQSVLCRRERYSSVQSASLAMACKVGGAGVPKGYGTVRFGSDAERRRARAEMDGHVLPGGWRRRRRLGARARQPSLFHQFCAGKSHHAGTADQLPRSAGRPHCVLAPLWPVQAAAKLGRACRQGRPARRQRQRRARSNTGKTQHRLQLTQLLRGWPRQRGQPRGWGSTPRTHRRQTAVRSSSQRRQRQQRLPHPRSWAGPPTCLPGERAGAWWRRCTRQQWCLSSPCRCLPPCAGSSGGSSSPSCRSSPAASPPLAILRWALAAQRRQPGWQRRPARLPPAAAPAEGPPTPPPLLRRWRPAAAASTGAAPSAATTRHSRGAAGGKRSGGRTAGGSRSAGRTAGGSRSAGDTAGGAAAPLAASPKAAPAIQAAAVPPRGVTAAARAGVACAAAAAPPAVSSGGSRAGREPRRPAPNDATAAAAAHSRRHPCGSAQAAPASGASGGAAPAPAGAGARMAAAPLARTAGGRLCRHPGEGGAPRMRGRLARRGAAARNGGAARNRPGRGAAALIHAAGTRPSRSLAAAAAGRPRLALRGGRLGRRRRRRPQRPSSCTPATCPCPHSCTSDR